MTPESPSRTAHAGVLLLVLFAGFEIVQAIGQHDATLLLGAWLALSAASVLAMRSPATRTALLERARLNQAFIATEASWLGLAAVGAVLALVAGRSATWVWAVAALIAAVLTPLAVDRTPV